MSSIYGDLAIATLPLKFAKAVLDSQPDKFETWTHSCVPREADGSLEGIPIKPNPNRQPSLSSCAKAIAGTFESHFEFFDFIGFPEDEVYFYWRGLVYWSEFKTGVHDVDARRLRSLGESGKVCSGIHVIFPSDFGHKISSVSDQPLYSLREWGVWYQSLHHCIHPIQLLRRESAWCRNAAARECILYPD